MALCKKEVREWDLKNGSARDSALKGRKPKLETAKRHTLIEVKGQLEYKIILALWDIQVLR